MRVSLPISTAGWRPVPERTLPAAYPSRSTKSGVMGLCPTVPRTPSVPKCLRLILISLPDRDDVPGFFHVVDPQYCRAALEREQSHREAARQALVDRPAGDLSQGGLAG